MKQTPCESFYDTLVLFQSPGEWNEEATALLGRLADHEPILGVDCGAGQHALWWQERDVKVTAVDASPNAGRTASERVVRDARAMDMFDFEFDRDRFGAVHAVGTQLGLAGSIDDIRDLLAEFAGVARGNGIAVVDTNDPTILESFFGSARSPARESLTGRFTSSTRPDRDRRSTSVRRCTSCFAHRTGSGTRRSGRRGR